jgi:hypothetical protein
MAISGTSMASPHVAGVAALVRAADPGVPPAQVVQAIKEGGTPLASLAPPATATGRAANAVGAIDRALALPNPAPVTPTPQPATPQPPPPPPPEPPSRARFASVALNNRGVLTIGVRGDAGTTGVLTLTANITAARVRRIGRKAFRIGSTGRATVRVRLSRPALRQLRRTRRLRATAKAVLTNAAGLKSTSRAAIRLRLRVVRR